MLLSGYTEGTCNVYSHMQWTETYVPIITECSLKEWELSFSQSSQKFKLSSLFFFCGSLWPLTLILSRFPYSLNSSAQSHRATVSFSGIIQSSRNLGLEYSYPIFLLQVLLHHSLLYILFVSLALDHSQQFDDKRRQLSNITQCLLYRLWN